MCPGGVFLDLLPKTEVIFEFFPALMLFVHNERIVGELILGQEHVQEFLVNGSLFLDFVLPFFFFLGQVVQNYFPTILPQDARLIGDSLPQEGP